MSLFETPMPAIALLCGGSVGLSQMHIRTPASLRVTQQSRTFLGRLQTGPSTSVNYKKRLRLRIPQPRSGRLSDQELALKTLKGTFGCSQRPFPDLCTRCCEGRLRGSVLCDPGRAAHRKHRSDEGNSI